MIGGKELQRLKDKVIVISGGTKGVGKYMVKTCLQEGAYVVFGGRDQAAADHLISSIDENRNRVIFVHTDLLNICDCENLFNRTYELYGKIDGFFNYAGVTPISPLDECDENTFDLVMNVNFKACFFCCQQAIKFMRLNGGGSIVLTGSAHAWGGEKDRAVYACSKGVLKTLMEHISHQYASERIRCNYLTLGWTLTEGEIALRASQGEDEYSLKERASQILPMGRICMPYDYKELLIYLLSDSSSMMTGSILRVTGGEYI